MFVIFRLFAEVISFLIAQEKRFRRRLTNYLGCKMDEEKNTCTIGAGDGANDEDRKTEEHGDVPHDQATYSQDNDNEISGKDASSSTMPEEQLCSDDSDTAGYYQVNSTGVIHNSASSNSDNTVPSYQRGIPSSSSEEDSSFDVDSNGEGVVPSLRRRLGLESSSSSSSDDDDDNTPISDLNIDISKVKVKNSLFCQAQSRAIGDFGYTHNYTGYTQRIMGNLNFVRRLRCVKKLEFHTGCVNSLNFNRSGSLLASGSDDTKVAVWDMKTCKPYLTFSSGHESNVFQTKFMPYSNDSQVVTCARDGQVRLAELSATGICRNTKKLAQHGGSAQKLAVENDPAHCLLSVGDDSSIFQIDLRVKKPKKLLQTLYEGRKVPLYSIDKHPYNPYEFIVGGRDHFVRVYDKRKIADGEGVLKKYYPHKFANKNSRAKNITCAVYSYDGTEILATYKDDDIHLFDNEHSDSADCVKTYSGHRNNATIKGVNFFGPKSEYIVSGSDCGNVFLWDKESTQAVQIQKGDEGGVVNVLEPHLYLPYLAISGLDNDIKLFAPEGDDLTDMSKHSKLVKNNRNKRSSAMNLFSAEIDRHFLLAAMRHMEFRRRRRAELGQDRGEGDEANRAGRSYLDSDTDSDDDDDDDDRPNRSLQCVTS